MQSEAGTSNLGINTKALNLNTTATYGNSNRNVLRELKKTSFTTVLTYGWDSGLINGL